MQLFRNYFIRTFSLDLRALALLRIGIGLLLLIDLYTRATDLEAHYANSGVLPLHALFEHSWNPYFFSFHTASGLWQVQALYFGIAAFFALCLIFGFQTRVATVLSWVFLLSLQNRNPMVLQGGDDLLRMLLFWGIFLPWHRRYSLDSRKTCRPATFNYFSAATVGVILQLFLLYFCTSLMKNAPEWNIKGTAIYFALSLDQILLPVGKLLYPHYALLRFLTFSVLYTELFIPFLLLIPFRVPFFRMVVILVLFSLHLGIGLTLFVGLFYLINMVSLLALLPTGAMDWLESKFLPRISRVCNRGLDFWGRKSYRFPASFTVQVQASPLFPVRLRQFREIMVTALVLYVIWWNLDNTPQKFIPMPQAVRWPGYVLRTDQNWGMFSPAVFKDDGWYILKGTTKSNNQIDLNRNGQQINYRKPAAVVDLFKNDRWRKYTENYLFIAYDWMRPYYCNYLLRLWNGKNGRENRLKSLEVIYMKEVSLPNYKTLPLKREVLCRCGN